MVLVLKTSVVWLLEFFFQEPLVGSSSFFGTMPKNRLDNRHGCFVPTSNNRPMLGF